MISLSGAISAYLDLTVLFDIFRYLLKASIMWRYRKYAT